MITPLACPITTFSSTLLSRSKARPFSGSSCLPTTGNPSASSSTTRWRFARSAAGKLARPTASSSCGRVRVRSQLEHCPPSVSVSQVQPERVRLRHTYHSRPSASTYCPFSSTGTIARSARENPSREPQDTQREFSKWSGLVADATAEGLHARSLPRPPAGRITAMTLLDSWTHGEHSFGGVTHPTYRKGSGPGVVVIHEIPGITPEVDRLRRGGGGGRVHGRDAAPVRHPWRHRSA